MTFDSEKDEFIFSSGQRMYANNGIVGISQGDDGIEITEGYDGGIDSDIFTLTERQELAAWAIALWTEWAKGRTV